MTRVDTMVLKMKRMKELHNVTPQQMGKALENRLNGELNAFGVYVEVDVIKDQPR